MALTPNQVQEIEQTIIKIATPYIGLGIGPETAPLIGKVREELLKQYQNVEVHLAYFNATNATSVEATVDFNKVSVVFTPAPA